MATATVIACHKDAFRAYLYATVPEGGVIGTVEYHASTPLLDAQGNPKSTAQLQADLTAALAAIRNQQLATHQALPISGTLQV